MGPTSMDEKEMVFNIVSRDENNQETNVKPSDILKKYRASQAKHKSTEDKKMVQLENSLEALNIMSISLGLIRAKNAFKKKLSHDNFKLEDIKNVGEKQWEEIEKTFVPKLKLEGHSVSEKFLESEVTPSFPHPPPPPPPPPMPSLHSFQENFTDSKLSRSPKEDMKLVKLHWKPLDSVSHDSLWASLPVINIKMENLNNLFQIKGTRKVSHQEIMGKPKEILVLSHQRSNHINIGIKKLPSLSYLKTAILSMDNDKIKREGIDKLQSLIGTAEEIEMIKEAQKNNPDVPLGNAEQYLLVMDSIPDLNCRLKLWAFKTDFSNIETDILGLIRSLEKGSNHIKSSKIFKDLMSIIRNIGNHLNNSKIDGFLIQYLSKLTQVKDTNTKKSLLYHVNVMAVEAGIETSKLEEDFSCLEIVSQTDFDRVKLNVQTLEESCKDSLAFVKLANYDNQTGTMVNTFLQDAAKRILAMKKITEHVLSDYKNLLDWFGIPQQTQPDHTPMVLAQILLEFARNIKEANNQLACEQRQENRRKKSVIENLRKNSSSIDPNIERNKSLHVPGLDKKQFSANLDTFLKLSLAAKK